MVLYLPWIVRNFLLASRRKKKTTPPSAQKYTEWMIRLAVLAAASGDIKWIPRNFQCRPGWQRPTVHLCPTCDLAHPAGSAQRGGTLTGSRPLAQLEAFHVRRRESRPSLNGQPESGPFVLQPANLGSHLHQVLVPRDASQAGHGQIGE